MKRTTKTMILFRIAGLIMAGVSILLVCAEYAILCAIRAIGAGVAAWLGITGAAAGGVVLLSYIAVIGLILAVAVGILVTAYGSWWLLTH